jgi:hypothetical protein
LHENAGLKRNKKTKMRITEKISDRPGMAGFICALVLLSCAFVNVSSAQEAGRRSARSLTSEDLLNRPVIYLPPPPASNAVTATSGTARSSAGSTYYRDPSGAFTLSFPNTNWHVNKRAGSAGRRYNQRSFRRVETEGFASATANVYVLTESSNLPITDPSLLGADAQRELATTLATRFLSSNASLVSVEPLSSNAHAGLHIIADQTISRHVAVRASINVIERQGRLFVIVCCASPETFDAHTREFEVITNSLASSVTRS